MAVREVQGNHAQMMSSIEGGDAAQCSSFIPLHRKVIRNDEVDHSGFESDEVGLAAGQAANFTGNRPGLNLDAAAGEVSDSLGPDMRPETAELVRLEFRSAIDDVKHVNDDWRIG